MRKSDLVKSHKSLDDALDRYQRFAEKVIHAKRVLGTAEEKRDVMESILLRVCAKWEQFVERHLVKCVNRHPERLGEFLGAELPPHPSQQLCRALLFGRTYADFRSCGDLRSQAKKMLPDGKSPFEKIPKSSQNLIDDAYVIRNYLSHYSDRAQRRLGKLYEANYSITRFREPGYFLAADDGKRLQEYIRAFRRASQAMQS